jgi:hypothetical protein
LPFFGIKLLLLPHPLLFAFLLRVEICALFDVRTLASSRKFYSFAAKPHMLWVYLVEEKVFLHIAACLKLLSLPPKINACLVFTCCVTGQQIAWESAKLNYYKSYISASPPSAKPLPSEESW